MEIFEFKDIKTVPDVIQKYSPALRDSRIPLIIDNGSYQCRVGWLNQNNPVLKFKSVIAKPRKERTKKDGEIPATPQIQVGNNITNLEAVRFQLKTQFDRNVVTHFEAQEHIFDYLFTHMGIDNEGAVPHPIVITEPFLNPNYSRQLMSELLFECYGVPSIAYGVDALFGYNHGQTHKENNCLLVNLSYYDIHIIPILNNKIIYKHSRRINTGGFHVITFLNKLLQLKYPAHSAAITLGRVEELLHGHCKIAYNYQEELNRWMIPEYYEEHIRRVQLPYTTALPIPGLTLEQQKERKKELARRLMEMNARKRDERLAEDEEKLSQLLLIQDLYDEGNEEEFACSLNASSMKSFDELQKTISTLNTRIERTKQKILAANSGEDVLVEDNKIKSKFEPGPHEDLQTWLMGVKRKKQDILNKRAARKQRRTDMAKRRTAAAQERMRIISQLARKEKGNDDFGLRDEDWDVYKTISREGGDSDSEMENEKLIEFDEIIRQHEPNAEAVTASEPGEAHQLHIGVERYRAVELFFQPSMIGSIEAGLTETIGYVLSQFPATDQQLLVDNVILMGGCALLSGLKERLIRELREIRPFKSKISVRIADNPDLCGWIGARNWAAGPLLQPHLTTRADYAEYGGEFFRMHASGNVYQPSPKAQGNAEVEI